MEEPSCKYCGCKNIACLVRCSKTGLYFCNGKGDTSKSHILHHLQTMNYNEITLPEKNFYHNIPFKCYVCESANIFNLGFIVSLDKTALYIVCNSNCKNKLAQIEPNINQDYFDHIISDGYIRPNVVSIPNPEEYKTIPISRVIEVCQEIRDKFPSGHEIRHSKLKPLRLQYQSRQEYVSNQLEFVNIEQKETKNYISSLQFSHIELNWEDSFHCEFKAPTELFKNVKVGNTLKFQQEDIQDESLKEFCIDNGYITAKCKNFNIKVTLSSTKLHSLNTKTLKSTVKISIQFDSIPFERQQIALHKYSTSEHCMHNLISNIITGNIGEIFHQNRLHEIPYADPGSVYFPAFSASQVKCMQTALSRRFSMILGPPGSGKTTMVAALCFSFARSGVRPVLVCAQTDSAANAALLTIARTGLNVLRFVSSAVESFGAEVDKYLTHRIALNHFKKFSQSLFVDFEMLSESERRKVDQFELEIIEECDILCVTCNDAGDEKLMDKLSAQFYTVVIDECCQICDSSLVVPAVKNCQQLILFGDPNGEIKPSLRSNYSREARYDLCLMERLILIGAKPLLLKEQYRMSPELADYPSSALYGGFMQSKSAVIHNEIDSIDIWPNADFPMFFWNIKSDEEKTVDGFSIKNDQELNHVSILIDHLLKNKIQPKEIGVISPYLGQKELLIERLPQLLSNCVKADVNEIEIGTVDDFQGKEKNYIIWSLVRANDKFDIGVLECKNNFCVSLTRARYGLIIIGCANTFAKSDLWCQFINYCKEKNAFVEGSLSSLISSEFDSLMN